MATWVLFFFILLWVPSSVNGATDPSDVSALNVLYSSLNSPSQLTGWTSNNSDPCGQSWKGITCSGSAVTQIKLPGLELSGSLGYMLASMTSLIELDLSNNNLGGGSEIPYNLPPNLQQLNLAGNTYGGGIPYSMSSMVSLKNLYLGHNQLQGSLKDIFVKLSNVSVMDLSFNSLTGDLPESFSNLSSLTTLYLQNNQLTGTIDVLTGLPLKDLNVANNCFTGWIPDQLKWINNLQTDGNTWSLGPAPPPPPGTPPSSRKINPGHGTGVSKGPTENGSNEKKSSGFGVGGIIGILVSILVFGAILVFFWVRIKQRNPTLSKRKLDQGKEQDHERSFTPLCSNEVKEIKPIQPFPAVNSETLQSSAPTSLKPPPVNLHKSFDYDNDLDKAFVKKDSTPPPIKATSYSVADLQIATGSFSMDNLLGEGSFGRVYRAQFNDGKVLAVKKMNPAMLPNQSSEDFIEMVAKISNVHHPNIAELVGYCCEHEQNLLVYEFHKNGSLHDLLHILDEYSKPLVWNARVKIALGIARALE